MSEANKILLIGAGGHCLSVLDSLLSSYHYKDIGIVDKKYDIVEASDNIQKVYIKKRLIPTSYQRERLKNGK